VNVRRTVLASIAAFPLARPLGQAVVVENKAGAGGNIGADLVAKAPADGYTIVMGTVGTHAINPGLYRRMPYDALKDFAPIGFAGYTSAPVLGKLAAFGRVEIAKWSELVKRSGAQVD
jgi:tripartite-type tricarboxylate transporter receptor subunit TctC